jgi:hypothetical protein
LVEICGAGTVKITGLTLEAVSTIKSCAPELFAVIVGGGANLVMTGAKAIGPEVPSGYQGCQTGVGIQVGRKAAGQVGTATLSKDEVSAYNKNGITVDGPGSKATIKAVTVSQNPSPYTATNGIQVSRGAVGSITEAKISGNECNLGGTCGANGLTETQSAGVLFYEVGVGTKVINSEISKNDIGVYSNSQEETTKPQVSIAGDTLVEDRYEGVQLDQGYTTVNKDKITGPANIGIQVIQYVFEEEGKIFQAFGPRGTGSEDKVSGMNSYAVEGRSDNQPGDQFGSFKITQSEISNNPSGATVAGSVFTNNPTKLVIITTASDT